MTIAEGKISLTPKKEYPDTLEELSADYDGNLLSTEDKFDWGESV